MTTFSSQEGYDAAGLTQRHAEALRWGTDYFIGCHTADNELIGQIGDGYADHAQWDSPENMDIDRFDSDSSLSSLTFKHVFIKYIFLLVP